MRLPRVIERRLASGLKAIFALPAPALRVVAGSRPPNDRGDVVDLDTQVMLRLKDWLRFPEAHRQAPAEARASLERETRIADPSPPPVARVEERRCEAAGGEMRLRVYWPRESPDPLPVLVYFHGGGYVIGSLDTHDGVCRRLALGADCIVVSADYRLAPEDPFPAAVEDGVAAFEWAAANAARLGGAPELVGVGGDSAGGGLAAVVCHEQRDAGRAQPAFQLLVYPVTDETRSLPSHRLFAHGYYLEKPLKDWFTHHYLRPEEERDPRASPLHAERFDGLAPAVVVVAGFDILRDEGEAYARRLREAGVPVDELREPSLIHGFLNTPALPAPAAAIERVAQRLQATLTSAPSRIAEPGAQ